MQCTAMQQEVSCIEKEMTAVCRETQLNPEHHHRGAKDTMMTTEEKRYPRREFFLKRRPTSNGRSSLFSTDIRAFDTAHQPAL
jgi:hypothetical protein